MTTNKTVPTNEKVTSYLKTLDDVKQVESLEIIELMKEISGEAPIMWGTSIIGFGTYRYKYASGREGDWMKIGFSPRKTAYSLYLSCDADQFENELKHFGKFTRGKGCIYFKSLKDIDLAVFKKMLIRAYTETNDYEAKRSR